MAHIILRPAWYIPASKATPEPLYYNRRAFLKTLGLGATALAAAGAGVRSVFADAADDLLAAAPNLPSFERNARFADAGRALTDKKYPLFYNNFYEFGFSKGDPARNAKGFKLDPYTLEIDGLVEKPVKLGLEDIEKLGLEERVYRFRCVEAWAMTVPWVGVPLSKVLAKAEIKPEAKYVAFKSFYDPERAPGQRQKVYDWPYHEGLRLDEAMNELTLAVTGLYGKRLVPQSGTPLRIIIPWKYGFKGPKSVVKMTLVADQPPTLWNTAQPSEYKFYSNVDPMVPHPRWSQAREKLLGDEVVEVPTQWYNGYGDYVAHLYESMPRELY